MFKFGSLRVYLKHHFRFRKLGLARRSHLSLNRGELRSLDLVGSSLWLRYLELKRFARIDLVETSVSGLSA